MSMMAMVAILVVIYFSLVLFIAFYGTHIPPKYGNFVFIVTNVILFLSFYVVSYDVGDNFRFQTLDNISPFTFTTLPFAYAMKDKLRDYYFKAVAYLSVGMFVAMLVTPQYAYLFSFNDTASMTFLFDALCHLNCSIFGIYLIASGQAKLTFENLKKSVIFMYSVVACVVILNYLFHTNNFGMNPYGGYSIYMFNFFEDYWATLLAYVVGIFGVLALGFGSNYLLNKVCNNPLAFATKEIKETNSNEEIKEDEKIA